MITEQEPQVAPDRMYAVAVRIKDGEAGRLFTYCLEEDQFYIYDNGYWRQIFDLELLSIICTAFPNINRKTMATKKQTVEHLKMLVYKKLNQFNNKDWLNFPSCMIDAKKNKEIPHDPSHLSTLRVPYNYDPLAECPLWLSTLDGIFEGDKEKVDVLQEYMGYCLTRDVTREKALLLLGESRSGKSTILDTINHLIGEENVSSVALEYLSNPQYTPMLINKMVNIDWDVASGAENFEANFKIITSGEPVSVNQKFVATFKFRPYCKLVMAANRFPRITDHSSAFYKRLILLPCDRVFEPHEQDIQLKHKLVNELPGIFNWAMVGLHRLEARGSFEVNKKFMTDAIQDLREESNPVDVFFKETIKIDIVKDRSRIEKGDLYIKYVEWCKENGNSALSNIKFGTMVYQKYNKYTEKKSQDPITGKRVWKNLAYINIAPKEELQWKD